MKVDTLADLKKLLKVCNEHGVRNITIDGITMQIDAPTQHSEIGTKEEIKTPDEYTPEDVLMWSATSAVVGA